MPPPDGADATPEQALKAAIVMLASLDDLVDGDKLTVTVHKDQISALIMATLAVLPAVSPLLSSRGLATLDRRMNANIMHTCWRALPFT